MTEQQMKRSWLVQRLRKPRPASPLAALADALAFGGGYRNGGLSDEAMSLLSSIFAFDYMGAAEFEYGAVPQALQQIAKAADEQALTAFTIEDAIYVLCRSSHADEVESRVLEWATGAERLLEPTYLSRTLRPVHEWDGETVGWLELDNGFFFFTDEAMWRDVARLFGTPTPEVTA